MSASIVVGYVRDKMGGEEGIADRLFRWRIFGLELSIWDYDSLLRLYLGERRHEVRLEIRSKSDEEE